MDEVVESALSELIAKILGKGFFFILLKGDDTMNVLGRKEVSSLLNILIKLRRFFLQTEEQITGSIFLITSV